MAQPLRARPTVLSAHAGMILHRAAFDLRLHSAPRACGDDPAYNQLTGDVDKCSPRMRG